METRERETRYYRPKDGSAPPFRVWRDGIADVRTKAAIDARLARFRGGNFGDSGPIGNGASENRIDFGPGYRIYYGVDGNAVILLCGGDKSTQASDIATALSYWQDYKERKDAQKARLQKRSSRRPTKRP